MNSGVSEVIVAVYDAMRSGLDASPYAAVAIETIRYSDAPVVVITSILEVEDRPHKLAVGSEVVIDVQIYGTTFTEATEIMETVTPVLAAPVRLSMPNFYVIDQSMDLSQSTSVITDTGEIFYYTQSYRLRLHPNSVI